MCRKWHRQPGMTGNGFSSFCPLLGPTQSAPGNQPRTRHASGLLDISLERECANSTTSTAKDEFAALRTEETDELQNIAPCRQEQVTPVAASAPLLKFAPAYSTGPLVNGHCSITGHQNRTPKCHEAFFTRTHARRPMTAQNRPACRLRVARNRINDRASLQTVLPCHTNKCRRRCSKTVRELADHSLRY